jgi:hypothetical protein
VLRTVWVCVCLTQGTAWTRDLGSEKGQNEQSQAQIHEAVFRWLAKRECNAIACLLSIDRKGIEEALYRRVKTTGRVKPASEDDFIVEHGAYRGFSQRNSRILDISRITRTSDSEVLVNVSHLMGAMSSRECRYRLTKQDGLWAMDEKETICTIS